MTNRGMVRLLGEFMTRCSARVSAFVCLNLLASAAWSQETTNYTYDALGRLTASSSSGGPQGTLQTSTLFDRAGNRSNYTVGVTPPAKFSIGDLTDWEGVPAILKVTRTDGSKAQSVSWATADGTATQPSDYTQASGTVNFAIGQLSKDITVQTKYTSNVEPLETFSVILSNPTNGAIIDDGTAVVSLKDAPNTPKIEIESPISAEEGKLFFVKVTRLGPTASPMTINYTTVAGTAKSPSDFEAASGSMTLPAGLARGMLGALAWDDTIPEPTETYKYVFSNPTYGALIAPGEAVVNILDNDTLPVLSFSSAAVSVAENVAGGTITLTVTKTGAATAPSTVAYAINGITATADSDFSGTNGTLTFAANETSKTITIGIVDDLVTESSETFNVVLSSPSGATLGTTTAVVTITDNDSTGPTPQFSFSPAAVSVAENVAGGNVSLTVVRSGLTTIPVSVNYATSNSTAIAGSDYQPVSNVLAFAAGETSKTFTVGIINDTASEGTETFNVSLAPQPGFTIGTGTAIVTITDDDGPPVFSITGPSGQVNEGSSAVFTVTKTGSSGLSSTVNFATSNGTAIAGQVYTGKNENITFSPSENSKIVSVSSISNLYYDGNTTFTATITPVSNSVIGSASASATIKDLTSPPVLIIQPANSVAQNVSKSEGAKFDFNVFVNGALVRNAVNIAYTTGSPATATAGVDYTSNSGTMAITSSGSFSVQTTDDLTIEPDEYFTASISSSSGYAIQQGSVTATIVNNDFPASPPVANPDNAGSVAFCGSISIDPIANDSDPNNLALTLDGDNTSTPGFTKTISGNTLFLEKTPGGTTGVKTLTYRVRNSAGAWADGTITVTVTGPSCL